MIKKSVFENEIIAGMQNELKKQASNQDVTHLVKAADYLNSAAEIFEEAGLTKQADNVIKLLSKIATSSKRTYVQQMPSINKLMEMGVTQKDLAQFFEGSPIAKAKVNVALLRMGYTDRMISELIGSDNLMSEEDAIAVADPNRNYSKMWDWMKNPKEVVDSSNIQPGEELSFTSIAKKKHKNPEKISDRHTKGLTSDKMIANLKDHGTEFNMSDDYQGWDNSLDNDGKKVKLHLNQIDPNLDGDFEMNKDQISDLLNLDISFNDDDLSVDEMEEFPEINNFEDEID